MFGFKSKEEKASLWYRQLPVEYTLIMNDSKSIPTNEAKAAMEKVFNGVEISYDENFNSIFIKMSKQQNVKRIYFSYGIDSICEKLNELMYRLNINIRLSSSEFTKNDNEYIKMRRERFEGTVFYDLNQINKYLNAYGYEIICFIGMSKNQYGDLVADEPRFVTIVRKNN